MRQVYNEEKESLAKRNLQDMAAGQQQKSETEILRDRIAQLESDLATLKLRHDLLFEQVTRLSINAMNRPTSMNP